MQVPESTSVIETLSTATDGELLDAWASARSHPHFTELVRRYLGLVRGIALRQTGADHADDVAQLTFAILARKAPDLTGVRSLGAWLHRVAVLQCRTAVRRKIRERRDLQAAMEHARTNDARDPLAEALPFLDDAIGNLKESDRELIHLRYSEGLTFPEVARRTGRSEAALRQQASRAVEKLARLLRRRGVEVPATAITAGLGTTLAGKGSASAAGVIATAAISSSAGMGGLSLVLISLFTMSTTKTILSAAFLAAIIAGGPVIWRANEIRELELTIAKSKDKRVTAGMPETPSTAPGPGATRAKRERSEPSLPPGTEMQQMLALAKMMEAEFKSSLTDWLIRKAEIDSRRTALALGLSPAKEESLRMLLSEQAREVISRQSLRPDQHEARAKQRAEDQAKLDEWFTRNLTPEQMESRRTLDGEMLASATERLAEDSLYQITSKIPLTDEQKTRLFEVATKKATEALQRNDHTFNISAEFLLSSEIATPVEELSTEVISRVLDSDQRHLWEQAKERDAIIRETLPHRLLDRAAAALRSPLGDKILEEMQKN